MARPQRTWIVVGDASRARIFEEGIAGPWHLCEEFDHPEGRAHTRDVVSDQQGRVRQSGTPGTNAGMAPRTDPADVAAARFARTLAERVDAACHQQAFDKLVLVAPPHFLGALESALGKETARHVTRKVDKDFTHHSAKDVEQHLRD